MPAPFDGVRFQLCSVVEYCFDRTIKSLGSKGDEILEMENLIFVCKGGFDGSGGHSIHHQLNNCTTNNIIMTMITPLSIKSGNHEVWLESNPSSANTQRPVSLQLGKETIESLRSFGQLTEDMVRLEANGLEFTVKGKHVSLKVIFRLTEMDRKAADAVTSLGGAFCDLCFLSREDAHQCDSISSIRVERTLQSTIDICETVPSTPSGDLKTKPGDYSERKGVMRLPTTQKDVESIQALHMLLRGADWILKLTYHEVAGVNHWSEGASNRDLQFIKNAKKKIQVWFIIKQYQVSRFIPVLSFILFKIMHYFTPFFSLSSIY